MNFGLFRYFPKFSVMFCMRIAVFFCAKDPPVSHVTLFVLRVNIFILTVCWLFVWLKEDFNSYGDFET